MASFSFRLLLWLPLVAAVLLGLCVHTSRAQGCSTSVSFNNQNRVFSQCSDLSVQGATMAWTYNQTNRTLEVLFAGTAPASGGWVGWGINLGPAPAMVGAQTFIGFQASNGSTLLTYNVTAATKGGTTLRCTPISLHVLDKQIQIQGTSIAMLVVLQLAANQSTVLNHVWNRGSTVTDFAPGTHGFTTADLTGLKAIDMSTGASSGGGAQVPNIVLKNRHAVLNTVGWGIMLPIGVMGARYLKPFTDPAWFYFHVFVQMAGYAVGVAGWATGIRLGNLSVGVMYKKHRSVGIALFAIATLQVTAILLRPNKDHKYRKGWNWYHYTLGVTILTLGILNIFFGFDILQPGGSWRRAYVGVLIALAALAVLLEAATWLHYFSRRRRGASPSASGKPFGASVGGAHGVGNGAV